jgi:MerR family copper efflux transcriptional regulator
VRITEAARRLDTTPRMLRYRERLGLLPGPWPARRGRHRHFSEHDVAAVALALRIEQRYRIGPAALAFGLRVLAEPTARAEVAELGRRIGMPGPPPARALEFEQRRAQRLLDLAQPPAGRPGPGQRR